MKMHLIRSRFFAMALTAAMGLTIGAGLFWNWYTSSYGEYVIENVNIVDSQDYVVPKETFLELLYAPPFSPSCPRFHYLEHFGTDFITLAPMDLLVIFSFSGYGSEDVIQTSKEKYEGKVISIYYMPPRALGVMVMGS